MRLKGGKGALSLLVSDEAGPGSGGAAPYRLVPAAAAGSAGPAVPIPEPDFSLVAKLEQAAAPAAAQPDQQQQQQQQAAKPKPKAAAPAPAPTGPSGRPQRKRKATAWSEDMIPTDALSRRGPKARPPPGPAPSAPRPAPPPRGSGIQLVTMSTPGGGTVTGLAVPAAALLPALLKQQALLQARGGAALQASAMPYKLVPPAPASAPSSGGDASAPAPAPPVPPAVQVAAPRDVAHVAKRLDEEERQKVLAVSDARVALQVLPGTQVASRGSSKPFPVPKPVPPRSGAGRAASADGGAAAGKGRVRGASGRYVKRATPEPLGPRLNLPPGTWHPGFESFDGVTHVSVLQAPAAPLLPAVAVGQPARLSQPMLVDDPQAEAQFSEDPLRSSLEYLRHAAQTAGRPLPYSGAAQAAVAAQQRAHKEHLARAHFARDRRRFAKERVEGTRKSVRVRIAPEVFAPPPAEEAPRRVRARPPRPEDATDVRVGEEYTADLPTLRPRPAAPLPEEQRFVAGLVCRAGELPPPRYDAQQTAALPAASATERAAAVAAAHEALVAALGPARAAAMGLTSCGAAAFRGLLSESEEAALEAGMREFGRAFHTIRAELLPARSVFDLQNYYFNIWKLRATPAARAWYEEKAAEKAARAAEQEELERQAEAEAAAQRAKQEAKYKRRMLKEVVQWVKGAARAPLELPNRPVVAQRAQRAAKLIGGMNAAPAQAAEPEQQLAAAAAVPKEEAVVA